MQGVGCRQRAAGGGTSNVWVPRYRYESAHHCLQPCTDGGRRVSVRIGNETHILRVVYGDLCAVKFMRGAGIDEAQQLLDNPNWAQGGAPDRTEWVIASSQILPRMGDHQDDVLQLLRTCRTAPRPPDSPAGYRTGPRFSHQ